MVLTNPTDGDYLQKVSEDYGSVHAGYDFSVKDLRVVGEGTRKSYWFFSTYSYRFGNLGVTYFGMAKMVVYTGSFNEPVKEKKEEDIAMKVLSYEGF